MSAGPGDADRLARFLCPRCGQGTMEMPELWREFWAAHPADLAVRPDFPDMARAWFAARGHPEATDQEAVCPACLGRENLARWLTTLRG